MIKTKYYRYLGTNGVLETVIELPGVYHTSFYHIAAENGKVLTNGTEKVYSTNVSEKDLDKWTEVDK